MIGSRHENFLVEYGAGNLPSVERALARQGIETERAATPEAIRAAETLILPGVGHFGQLMRTLGARGLIAPLRDAIARGTPLLGICLGLQALFADKRRSARRRRPEHFPGTRRRSAAHRPSFRTWAGTSCAACAHRCCSKAFRRTPISISRTPMPRWMPAKRPWRCAITARRLWPRSSAGTSSPCSFIPKNRATWARAFWPISSRTTPRAQRRRAA